MDKKSKTESADVKLTEKKVEQKDSDEEEEPENLQYKVVVLGNGTAGKT